jgi:predicted CopG family antitoxin
MATKTITITEEAYEGLVINKKGTDSFSDVIKRLTKRKSLFDLVGIISSEHGKELHRHSKEIRKQMTKEMKNRARRLK